jgi:cytochrome c-type biogenesis protein CcmH/NrfG
MSDAINEAFDAAIDRYTAGESAATLIPVFQDICKQSPRMGTAWTCLSWLYLLEKEGDKAVQAATQALRLDAYDPQARVNLAVALLETKQKGVRDQVEVAKKMVKQSPEAKEQVESSFADGLQRNPDWEMLKRVRDWIAE